MKNFAFIIVIENIKNPNLILSGGVKNKYKGAYRKIFNILNEDFVFVEFESEDEELIGNDFYLYFNLTPDLEKLERILKIPNVEIISQRYGQIGLLAPNGKPSNLNATQYELVRTSAFKKWFGDWEKDPANSSKVIDENGEPLVLYHGTTEDFSVFLGGSYFTDDYMNADGYASGEIVLETFLNIKKPLVIKARGRKWDNLKNKYGNSTREIVSSIDETKYDGVIFDRINDNWFDDENGEPQNVYFTINPNQIKLADGTNTTFNSGSDDIRFEQGGEIDWVSTKSINIKINNDLYRVQYQQGERGDTESVRRVKTIKKVWFAKVISKNNKEVVGRLCEDPELSSEIYGFSLKEVENGIYNSYIENQLYLIIEDDYGNEKEIIHIEVSEKSKYENGGKVFNDNELLAKFKKGESIGFTAIAHLKSKGLIPRADGVKRKSEKYMEKGGRTISQTPSPKKDRIVGSDVNKKSSSKNLSSAKLIKFDDKTISAIKNKVKEHNEKYPNKKINLASAKAVVRRGMGAYSSSHRPTISSGKPNSRVAWGLARLNAFTYKIINGKSKSGKYKQDDDLIEELGFKVADYKNGGEMKKDIRCINCGWEWNKKDSEAFDMYVCHKCGFDNTTFYTSIPVNNYSKGGKVESKNPNYLKMFLGK
jgi:hypothetical protein